VNDGDRFGPETKPRTAGWAFVRKCLQSTYTLPLPLMLTLTLLRPLQLRLEVATGPDTQRGRAVLALVEDISTAPPLAEQVDLLERRPWWDWLVVVQLCKRTSTTPSTSVRLARIRANCGSRVLVLVFLLDPDDAGEGGRDVVETATAEHALGAGVWERVATVRCVEEGGALERRVRERAAWEGHDEERWVTIRCCTE
jgi:hypothetical protein